MFKISYESCCPSSVAPNFSPLDGTIKLSVTSEVKKVQRDHGQGRQVRNQQKGHQKCKSNLKGKKRKAEKELNLYLGERSAQGEERRTIKQRKDVFKNHKESYIYSLKATYNN